MMSTGSFEWTLYEQNVHNIEKLKLSDSKRGKLEFSMFEKKLTIVRYSTILQILGTSEKNVNMYVIKKWTFSVTPKIVTL